MGNSKSTLEQNPDEFAKFDGVETLGYRVLDVQPNSPASASGLVSYLDFLIGCNGELLLANGECLEDGDEYDDVDFNALLKNNEENEVELCKCYSLSEQFFCVPPILVTLINFRSGTQHQIQLAKNRQNHALN
jgi:hypothetical protein